MVPARALMSATNHPCASVDTAGTSLKPRSGMVTFSACESDGMANNAPTNTARASSGGFVGTASEKAAERQADPLGATLGAVPFSRR
jgi:hypothetical protein